MSRLRFLRLFPDGHGSGIAQFAIDNGDEQTVEVALSFLLIWAVAWLIDGFYFILLHKSTSVKAHELADEVTTVYTVYWGVVSICHHSLTYFYVILT